MAQPIQFEAERDLGGLIVALLRVDQVFVEMRDELLDPGGLDAL